MREIKFRVWDKENEKMMKVLAVKRSRELLNTF
ncbi:Uncharacterised protein [uncultured Leptotrichia sp.]|nr:Uncharacterised protein [uncultured Leptotrichia sp.]